jgi:type I restriction enzyme R subunit
MADGSDAETVFLSANAECYMQWRTIDGVNLHPLGQFRELESLVRNVLLPS